jgi:hypothetical protein
MSASYSAAARCRRRIARAITAAAMPRMSAPTKNGLAALPIVATTAPVAGPTIPAA